MKPKIAILSRINDQRYTVNLDYVNALETAGADVIILHPCSRQLLSEILSQCDGLCVPGGEDVNPILYQEVNHYSFPINKLIEQLDIDSIEIMHKQNKPILGICRGLQILNVVFGGTLYQDIKTQTSSNLNHSFSQDNHNPIKGHNIVVLENTELSKILPSNIEVNSYHHQSIKDCAKAFTISAYSEDGIIEAIESENIIALQWHPERMTSIQSFQKLFNHFIHLCEHSKQ